MDELSDNKTSYKSKYNILATSEVYEEDYYQDTSNVLLSDGIHDFLIDNHGNTSMFNIRKTLRNEITRYFKKGLKFYFNKKYNQFILTKNGKRTCDGG